MVTPNTDKHAWWIKDSYSREEIDQLVQWGLDHFWTQNHQMADLVAPGGYNIMMRGEGCYVYDIEGNRYIDAMAGLFLKNIGHSPPGGGRRGRRADDHARLQQFRRIQQHTGHSVVA